MNAIIIEDEKLSAEHLINLLKRIDTSINIIATFDCRMLKIGTE